jgi:hypothetical protein
MNKSERLYRAQPKDCHNCPITPTAMRPKELKRLEELYTDIVQKFSFDIDDSQ